MKRRHREHDAIEPFIDWERQNFPDPTPSASDHRNRAEIETDRDLTKCIEQLLCDIHEGHERWTEVARSHATRAEGEAVKHILYTLTRAASMNAVVARSNQEVQREVHALTRGLWYFTAVLVGLTIVLAVLAFVQSYAR